MGTEMGIETESEESDTFLTSALYFIVVGYFGWSWHWNVLATNGMKINVSQRLEWE